eukprot:5525316-Prymnesium_polylepis.1
MRTRVDASTTYKNQDRRLYSRRGLCEHLPGGDQGWMVLGGCKAKGSDVTWSSPRWRRLSQFR